jgi:hypothetical protein
MYPVDADEIFQTVERLPDSEAVGDLSGYIKVSLQTYFKNDEHMNALLEQMRIK